MTQARRPFRRIGYLSGPVNGEEVVRAWYDRAQTGYFGTVYLRGFCEVVTERGAQGVVVTYRQPPDSVVRIGDFTIYNVSRRRATGLRFHLEAVRRMLRSFSILRKERVELVVITEGANYWFLNALLRLFGIEVVASLHCRIWSPFEKPSLSHQLLHWLNTRFFYRRQRNPFMGVSRDIGRQVAQAARPSEPVFHRFMPTYDRSTFAGISPPPASGPFVILSAGRIEVNKGIFDMVEVATILRERGMEFEMHFCGEGSSLDRLRESVRSHQLEAQVQVHGRCDREQLRELLGRSHVVVVPTRTDFEEGFAKTCAEGVLAGRPAVTSRVCPALEDLGQAAVEVEPNDVGGYADAFTRLMEDKHFYERKRAATEQVSAQFYNPANSYAAMLRRSIAAVEERTDRRLASRPDPELEPADSRQTTDRLLEQ